MNNDQKLQALQTQAKNMSKMLNVHVYKHEDKRKNDLFYLTNFGNTISPKCDYTGLQLFMLGMNRAIELYINE